MAVVDICTFYVTYCILCLFFLLLLKLGVCEDYKSEGASCGGEFLDYSCGCGAGLECTSDVWLGKRQQAGDQEEELSRVARTFMPGHCKARASSQRTPTTDRVYPTLPFRHA